MKRKSTGIVIIHLLAWILFILAPLFFSPGPLLSELSFESFLSLSVRSITLIALFYFNLFYLTPIFFKKQGWGPFVFTLIFLVVMVSFFNSSFHESLVEGRPVGMRPPPIPQDMIGFGPRPGRPPMMFASPKFSSFLITILVATASSLLVFREEWAKSEAEKQEQLNQRLAAELTALKLQFILIFYSIHLIISVG
ncbi:MAG: hypothetical protein QM734_00725 [Cyclobacteriaceae bacterium]